MTPYYDDGTCVIYHGDCLEVMSTLTEVGLVVTDPPYFQPATHYVPARGERPIRSLGDTSVLEFAFKAWAEAIDMATTDNASVYVFCDGQSYPITFRAFYSLGRVRPIVWDKVVSFNGYTWRHQHELIAWVEKHEAERIPTGDGDILRFRNVKRAERIHPAEKPVDLLSTILAKYQPTTVLDPFMGSASTLVAAAASGHRAIGIEIEERYCEIAAKRLALAPESLDFGGVA